MCLRMTKDLIPQAAAMLSRAFFDDPKLVYLIPDEKERQERARYLFEFELRYGMIYGSVLTTSENLEGVAVYLPSQKSEVTFWRVFRAGGFLLRKQLGKETMDRLMDFSGTVDRLHAEQAPGDHCYLFFIGIDPAFRQKGFASRLIRPVLETLTKKGKACYLCTQNEKNIGLYEHFGFRVIHQSMMPGSGIPYAGMVYGASGGP